MTTVQPVQSSLPLRLPANGTVTAWQEAIIGSEANGLRLVDVKVNVGDRVTKGQVLASFATEQVNAEVAQAQASFAEAQANALDAAGNAWGRDEVYWDNPAITPGASSIGVPAARHTYYAGSYNRLTDELYIGSGAPGAGGTTNRRLWGFSRASGQWTWKRTVLTSADGAINGHVLDDQNGLLRVWGTADGVNASYTYNLNTQTFSYVGWFPLYGRDAATVNVGRTVVGVEKQLRDYPTRNNYFTLNLDTNVSTTGAWVLGGGLLTTNFPSSAAVEGQSIVYIPSLNRYWLYTPGLWFQLDPTTTPWTASPLSFPLGTPVAPTGAAPVYNKLMYSSSLNAVISALDGAGNLYVYKL